MSQTLSRDKIGSAYCALMDEVKNRLDALNSLLAILRNKPDFAVVYAEACYLQIRKVCEIVALALAIAHNEMPSFRAKKIVGDWNADRLVKNTLKLNANAFPTPIEIEFNRNGLGHHHIQPIDGHMDAKTFAKIYASCGEKLHLGSVKRILDKSPIKLDMKEISEWGSAFVRLLNRHVVFLPSLNTVIVVTLKSVDHSGNASCIFAEGDNWVVTDKKVKKVNFEIRQKP